MSTKQPPNLKSHDIFLNQGHTFEAPGVSGLMDKTPLAGGGFLYRLEFKASEDCELNYHNSFSDPWIGSAFHLQGHSVMTQVNGLTNVLDSNSAVLMRMDTENTVFRLKKAY